MAKFKPLRPLAWEEVEAQHDWLMEQFEKGLNYAKECSRFYEDNLTLPREPEPYIRQSTFNLRGFRFTLGGTAISDYISLIRAGDIEPSAPTTAFEIVDVECRYLNALHVYRFEARHKGRVFTMHLYDESAAHMSDTQIREYVIREMTKLIRVFENAEVERPRF